MIFLLLLFINFLGFLGQWIGFVGFAAEEKKSWRYCSFEAEDAEFPEFTTITKTGIIIDYIFSWGRLGVCFLLFFLNFLVLFVDGERTTHLVWVAAFTELCGFFGGSFFGLVFVLWRWHLKDEVIN